MSQPTHIRATEPGDDTSVVETIEQHVWRAHALDKPELIGRILRADGRGRTMIFCKTKRAAQKLNDDLIERGFLAGAVHGDLGQPAREKALQQFRDGTIDVLVATDVAARGIDVENVTHVINYTCPDDEKTYLHRVGRTGRAGADGVAVTLVDWDDLHRWKLIDKALGLPFAEPIETYSTSEHVFTGLGIPRDATGRLKPAAAVPPRDSATRGGQRSPGKRDRKRTRSSRNEPSEGSGGDSKAKADQPRRRRRRTRRGPSQNPSAHGDS